MAKRRRTEIARIADPTARLVTYSKRRKGLFNKAYELSRLCGARVAVVVFSPAGKPCSFGDPSADEIISDYLRGGGCGDGGGDGEVMPPMGLSQWAEWVQTEWNACATEEDLESLILKYEAVRDCARVKLKALEDSHILSEQEMDSLFESLEGQGPALAALLTEGEGILTSPENPAAGGGSSAVESTPAVSDLEGCGSNDAGGGSLRVGSNPNLSEDCFVDSHGFWSSPEESAVGGGNLEDCFVDSHGFWSWPENSAAGGGSSAVESIPVRSDIDSCGFNAPGGGSLGMASTPTCPDLEDCGFDPDDFLNLLEECVQDGDRDNFLTSPEESAFGGGNSGVEPAPSDREGYGYDPIDFATLEDLGIPL